MRHLPALQRGGAEARAAALRRQRAADRGPGDAQGAAGEREEGAGVGARGAGRDPAGRGDPARRGRRSRAGEGSAAGRGEGGGRRAAGDHAVADDRAPEPHQRVGAGRRREPHDLRGPDHRGAGGLRRRRRLPPGGGDRGGLAQAGGDLGLRLAGERRAAGGAGDEAARERPQGGLVPGRARGRAGLDLLSLVPGARPRLHPGRGLPALLSRGLVAGPLAQRHGPSAGAGAGPSRGVVRADPAGASRAAGPDARSQPGGGGVAGDEAGDRAAPLGGRSAGARAALGRGRGGQGPAGPLAPSLRAPAQRPVHHGDLRRREAAADRGGPLRRRDPGQGGPGAPRGEAPARQRRHAVPRRDRAASHGAPGAAGALPALGPGGADRQRRGPSRGGAAGGGEPRAARLGGGARSLPGRPRLPAVAAHDRGAAAARAARGPAAADPVVHQPVLPRDSASG